MSDTDPRVRHGWGQALSKPRQERANRMAEAWAAGSTLAEIGREHGITGGRVRQIIVRGGLYQWVRAERRAAQELAVSRRARTVAKVGTSNNRRYPELWADQNRRYSLARSRAQARLRRAHAEEFAAYFREEKIGLGITPRSLMGGPIRKRRGASSG